MTGTDMKPSQKSRWTVCAHCYGALDTKGDIVHIRLDGVRRNFHPRCYLKEWSQHGTDQVIEPQAFARIGAI